jgi:hypothetical protein
MSYEPQVLELRNLARRGVGTYSLEGSRQCEDNITVDFRKIMGLEVRSSSHWHTVLWWNLWVLLPE